MSAKLSHEPQVVLTVHDPNQTGWVSSSGVETGQEGKTLPDPHHGCGPPPDGGLRAWLVAAGGFAIFFPTLGFSNSFGVMAQYYLEHQLHEKSTDDIAWIGSLSVFLSFFAGMLGGPLFDRFGSKLLRPAAVAYVFGIMMLSLCKTYYQIMLCQGVLMGTVMGFIQFPAVAAVSQYFDRRRAAALGITIAGSSVGGVIVPIVLSKMLNSTSLGFGWSVRIIGLITIPILSFAVIVVRPRLPPRTSSFWVPEMAHNKFFLGTVASLSLVLIGLFFPLFYLPTYATTRGMDATLAGYLSAILNASSTFGRVIPGVMADKWGRVNIYAVGAMATAVMVFCFSVPTTDDGLIVYAVVFGFTSGTIISGASVVFSLCCKDARDIGTYAGVGMAIAGLGGLVGPPLDGVFRDHFGGFFEASMFSGAVCSLGCVIALLTKMTKKQGLFGNVPTKAPLKLVQRAYDQLQKPLKNDSQLANFLSDYFAPAGTELIPFPTSNLTTDPNFLLDIRNPINREFVQQIVERWPNLTRTYNTSTMCESCESSFIPVERPFVIAGGRFREPYYWDSYWIIQGLLRTGGSFTNISKNQVENFLDHIETFGFVPNGARKYYLNRSQPPLLAQMVRLYIDYTGDTSILERALPLLIREHDFFQQNRSISVNSGGKSYTLQRYDVDNNQPRPESFREDWQQVNNITYCTSEEGPIPRRTLTQEQQWFQYKNLASGAESGWDFSSRFLADPRAAAAGTYFPLASINVVNTIPVDLNSMVYWNEATISSLLHSIGDSNAARAWEEKARIRSEAMAAIMWNEEFGTYFDYNMTSGSPQIFTSRDADALPTETNAAPSNETQVTFNVAQLLPFLTGAALPGIKSNSSAIRKAFARLSDYLDAKNGGISATNLGTSQQWDQPSVWPPLMQMMMEGLLQTPATHGEHDKDWLWTQNLALRLAQRYLDSAYCTWRATGGATESSPKLDGLNASMDVGGLMFEKYSDTFLNEAGSGGEYKVVVGFGWSNGVLIWVADTFRDKLQTPPCAAARNVSALYPPLGALGDSGEQMVLQQQVASKMKSAIELDPWDAGWTAQAAGGLA